MVIMEGKKLYKSKKISLIVLVLNLAVILPAQEKPEFRPTFENCSFYWKPTGKTDIQNLTLRYRKLGDKDWITAFKPVYIPEEKAWRGSILMLRENQTYETELQTPDGTLNDTFTTRNSVFPVGKTIELKTTGPVMITESGTADAYIRYTLPPGRELTGNAGMKAVLTVANAEFIILDGVILKANGAQSGALLENSRNIVLRNCEISDFGRTGEQRLDLDGKFYLKGSNKGAINYDAGIEIRRSGDILVERCAVYAPRGHANSWQYSHPAGPCAVFMNFAQGGVVLRYNDFFGSDLRRYNDVIEGAGNGLDNGGFFRDADIYGNLLALSNDDGIELEGGGMNLRFYLNHIRNSLCGVSTGSCRLGPVYVFRNLFTDPGDQHGYSITPFKNGHGNQGKGSVFFFNNTVADPVRMGFNSFHVKEPELELGFFKGWGRNNIVAAERVFQKSFFKWPSNFDHDLLFSQDSGEQKELAKQKQEKNAVWGRAHFVNAAAGDYRLSEESPGRNKAQAIPGLKVTHIGAFQEDGIAALPYRPSGLSASRRKFFFTPDNLASGQTFTVTAAANTPFRILQSDDFFSVEPRSGFLQKDVPLTLTVTYHPDKVGMARLSSGVASLRCSDGWSLPLNIFADNRDISVIHQGAIVLPVDVTEVDIPRDGRYWIFVEAAKRKPVDAALEIGNQKFERIRCNFSEYKRDREICQLILRERLDLKAGKVPFRIKFNSGQVSKVILTDNPEYIFR